MRGHRDTITGTLLQNEDALVRGHAGLAAFDPRTAWRPEKVGIPPRPGAHGRFARRGG